MMPRPRSALADQRGIALPLALVVLALLTSLTLAFLAMSSTEPVIAMNLKGGEEALALAEGGLERALWALANSGVATYGLANPLPAQVPTPFNGQQLVVLGGSGAYTITVAAGAGPNDRTITARGYVVRNGVVVPEQPAQLANFDIAARRAVQIRATARPVGGPGMDPPGALTVAGTVQMSGNSLVDGNDSADGTDNGCHKAGVTNRTTTTLSDGTVINNSISTGGSSSTVGTPAQQSLTPAQFEPYTFSDAQLAAIKALAQSQGTYIQPSSNAQFNLDVVNGLMFVDTVNGQPLGTPPDASKLANVKITSANNSGWLIVMGSIRIDGNVTYNGFIYARNDLSYKGTGTGGIHGAVVTGNIVDSVATVVDTDASGNSQIYYDCTQVANGGGTLNPNILNGLNNSVVTVVPGTWQEAPN